MRCVKKVSDCCPIAVRNVLLAVFLVAALLGSDSPKEYDGSITEESIMGTWEQTEVTVSGVRQDFVPCSMICKRGAITFTPGYSDMPCKIDCSRKPGYLDFKPPDSQTVKCIYQIDDDRLKIAFIFSRQDWRRPQRFDQSGVYLQSFKRVKK